MEYTSRKPQQRIAFFAGPQHYRRFAGQIAGGQLSINARHAAVVHIASALFNSTAGFAFRLGQSRRDQCVDDVQAVAFELRFRELLAWHVGKDLSQDVVIEICDLGAKKISVARCATCSPSSS